MNANYFGLELTSRKKGNKLFAVIWLVEGNHLDRIYCSCHNNHAGLSHRSLKVNPFTDVTLQGVKPFS